MIPIVMGVNKFLPEDKIKPGKMIGDAIYGSERKGNITLPSDWTCRISNVC